MFSTIFPPGSPSYDENPVITVNQQVPDDQKKCPKASKDRLRVSEVTRNILKKELGPGKSITKRTVSPLAGRIAPEAMRKAIFETTLSTVPDLVGNKRAEQWIKGRIEKDIAKIYSCNKSQNRYNLCNKKLF